MEDKEKTAKEKKALRNYREHLIAHCDKSALIEIIISLAEKYFLKDVVVVHSILRVRK